MEFPEVVDLNVGGRHLATSLATLTKYRQSKLAAMFSGNHYIPQDKDGRYFIDVDGDVFIYILNFLRFQVLPPEEREADVLKYAEYFGIEDISRQLVERISFSPAALYSKLSSAILRYSEYRQLVYEKITHLEIKEGLISLQISTKNCSDCRYRASNPRNTLYDEGGPYFLHIPHIQYNCHPEYCTVEIETEYTEKATLVSVLSYDLKKMGIHPHRDIASQTSFCKYARMFRVEFV